MHGVNRLTTPAGSAIVDSTPGIPRDIIHESEHAESF